MNIRKIALMTQQSQNVLFFLTYFEPCLLQLFYHIMIYEIIFEQVRDDLEGREADDR